MWSRVTLFFRHRDLLDGSQPVPIGPRRGIDSLARNLHSVSAMLDPMSGGAIVREARRRAGITQAELAERVGTTQSALARLERGHTEPSLQRVQELVRACGLDLRVGMDPIDESDWSVARANLALDVDRRVRQHQRALRFARAGRAALEAHRARA